MKKISLEEIYSIYLKHPVLSKDTRQISEGCIYISLRGESFDGNHFANEAIQNGAAYALIDNPAYQLDERFLLVDDCLETIQEMASYHRDQLKIPIIGITGSNGKTTSKELIASVLSKKYNTHFTQGNYNNHIGVPLTLLEISAHHEIAIIEMGANHQGEIEFLCNIAKPNYGLITNIGKAHLEGFGGIEGVKKGKSELYRHLESHKGLVFYNSDDDTLKSLLPNTQQISYGIGKESYCRGELTQSQPTLSGNWSCEENTGKINADLYGEYNFYNLLAAISIGNYFKVKPEDIDTAINEYQSDMNRSQKIESGSTTIFLDAYNANPSSMKVAIENLENSNYENKWAILGDMFELGDEAFNEHKQIVERIKQSKQFEKVLFVGKNFFVHKHVDKDLSFLETTAEAKEWYHNLNPKTGVVLIKGSRGMKLESILK